MNKAIAISILTALSGVAIATAQPIDARAPEGALRLDKPAHGGDCGRGGMHKIEKLDTNKDGKVSRDEMLSGATTRFDQADSNKDGALSDAEKKAAHDKHAQERFTNKDKNNDGVLTKDELPQHFAERLLKLDANSDGKLTKEELAKIGEMRGHFKGKMHGDKDKAHTRAELVAHIGERFSKLAANNDGALTEDELKQGRHGFRGHGGRHAHD